MVKLKRSLFHKLFPIFLSSFHSSGIMNLFPVLLIFLFLCTVTNSSKSPTDSPVDLSVNCGLTGTFTARNGREWIGDVAKHKPNSFLQPSTTSTVSHHKLISADPVPYKTARASQSQFSYAFQVSPGQKILRLHFHSAPHKAFKGFKALFTVEAGPFILLSNFSPSLTADSLRVNSFSKEFYLSIRENKQFNLTFTPETSRTLDATYAFINGIEIISVPASLSYFQDGEDTNGAKVVGQQSLVYVGHHRALELIHRQTINHSSARALEKADKVKNYAWKIAADVGFRYMIRLYFSDIGLMIFGTGDVEFQVLINGMIAQVKNKDDENKIPRFRDYIVTMRGRRKMGKRDLLISLYSYDGLTNGYGLLSGFEIFKLTNSDNSLAGLNPPLPLDQGSPSMSPSIFNHRNAVTFIAVNMISLLCIVVHMLREYSEANSTEEENKPSARAERLCRRFSLTEIQLATKNFSDGFFIGRGGFGKVYKGQIDGGHTNVAVKRLNPSSSQGAHEFLMEIETLSELRHLNLVSLIGYCNEGREMILVYDYISGGTLSDQLYKRQRESRNSSSLTWNQRLSICIGAARGLGYLHTGHGVIHRDVKTSNILLDENFIPKVSDFGLAKHEDRTDLQSHVSTRVKGTKGYLDPHYQHTSKLTRKTDTYAFGVVLFEVLCGKQAIDLSAVEDERVLTLWARDKINKGEVDEIVDLCLREEISPASQNTFVEIGERCLREAPKNRPTMSQVVQQLELALYQQEDNTMTPFVSKKGPASKPAILTLLNFGESISVGPHKPEKLIKILDMLEVITGLIPSITSPYSDDGPGLYVRTKCHNVLNRLRNCARIAFIELEKAAASNDSMSAVSGGGVHPLTRYVMNNIETLMDYSKTLDDVLKGDVPDEDQEEDPNMSPMSKHFRSLISILERNLDTISNLYKEESLQHLFLMNNVHYTAEKVKNSELRTVLGDEWIREHNAKFQQLAMNYERATWSSMLNFLKDEVIKNPGSYSEVRTLIGDKWIRKRIQQRTMNYEWGTWSSLLNISKVRMYREKLQSFYLAFEEVYKNQTGWSVPDAWLRDDLRISASINVIPAYRSFVGRYAPYIGERHIKYTGEDLEDYILHFFEGSQRSLNKKWFVM